MHTFEIGRLLGELAQRVSRLEQRADSIDALVTVVRTWSTRLAILGGIWGGAIGINIPADQVGAHIAAILRHVLR